MLKFIGAAVALVVLICLSLSFSGFSRPDSAMNRMVWRLFAAMGKYRALSVDANSVGTELRKFAHEVRWDRPPSEGPVTYVRHNRPAFPAQLKYTKASGIRVMDDRVELEFGGTPLHFGIVAFREGNDGYGVKKLGDGIWFYSEDERMH